MPVLLLFASFPISSSHMLFQSFLNGLFYLDHGVFHVFAHILPFPLGHFLKLIVQETDC